MIFYISLLSFYLFFSLFGKDTKFVKHKNRYLFFLLLPSFLLIAFRSVEVGADTFSYSYLYDQMKTKSLIDASSDSWMEIGYLFVELVFAKSGLAYYTFQVFITSFYFISIFLFVRKNSSNYALSCFLLLAMQFIFGMMNQTRMWIAICISLYGFMLLKKQKIFCLLFLILIASLIHKSVLVLIPFYFIYYLLTAKKISKKNLVAFLLLTSLGIAVLWNALSSILSSVFSSYSDYLSSDSSRGSIASIMLLAEYAFVFVFVNYKITADSHLLFFDSPKFLLSKKIQSRYILNDKL